MRVPRAAENWGWVSPGAMGWGWVVTWVVRSAAVTGKNILWPLCPDFEFTRTNVHEPREAAAEK